MESTERRHPVTAQTRGRFRVFWDLAFTGIRWIASHARDAYTTFGLLILGGLTVAIAATFGFAKIAGKVVAGHTLGFDDAVMRFMGSHQVPWISNTMVEVTTLGTGIVVAMIVAVSALFLWLYDYRNSATLLLVTTLGGLLLNMVLKLGFDRPRPQFFDWGTHAVSSSFPSGHAMSASIVYPTVAYLAARLQKTAWARLLTMVITAFLVLLICLSRVYLGVHYPSDVAAGVVVGLAWSAFCMTTLELGQLYAKRNAPAMVEGEHPPRARPIVSPGK
jgi:undecaprenyl-diphosphatase